MAAVKESMRKGKDVTAKQLKADQRKMRLEGWKEKTDKVIEARRPDIVLLKKKEKECVIIDIAIPGDCRAWRKEEEKIQKYNDLAWELRRVWKVKTKVVPIVIGALGTVTTRHRSFLAVLGVEVSFETIQKASLLGTAHILRKVLN
ncbi:uncharacterized protein LOC135154374 [Lytechinus pictus]|uniref:uncharacterized protein LOC135154374 n=1 Tax=Lytechinus pictus TaxID=7653 RepID=UPI0030B9EB44